ncbi:MAG: response regulator [Proteobacteria bacterium]|nr:MAG: response regulator [Pseudomonadota bacterium]
MARILLVDDDYDIRELGRALLSHMGHEVHTSDGAINALQVLRSATFDLLITDVNMPNHSGFDLLKMIRLEGKWPNLTSAMLTGRRERQDVERAVKEGAHSYIVKPLDPLHFTEKIQELLDKRNPPEETIALPQADFAISANIQMSVEIHSISEIGITLKSSYQFRSGTLLPLESELFKHIGIKNPLMRVFVSQKKDGDWETRLTYTDLSEKDAEKIRGFTSKQARPVVSNTSLSSLGRTLGKKAS